MSTKRTLLYRLLTLPQRYGLACSAAVVAVPLLAALLLASSAQSASRYPSGIVDALASPSAYSLPESAASSPTVWPRARVEAAFRSSSLIFIKNVGQFNENIHPGSMRAVEILGTPIILPRSGIVKATILFSETACPGSFGIYSPINRELWWDYRVSVGQSKEIGFFSAGTQLVFYIAPRSFCNNLFLSTGDHCRITTLGEGRWKLEWEDWTHWDWNDAVVEIELQPAYFISGWVSDASSNSIAGVTISAGAGGSTTTDANGAYTLTGLDPGTYTLTSSKSGYTFTPARRTVSVPPDATGQDFIGVADGGPPAPFLDLPFDYGGSVAAFVKALWDTDDKGRVDSWFDHAYPDYGKNGRLVLYDGEPRTRNRYNPDLGCFERRCYDGHSGFDFTYSDPQPDVPGNQSLAIRPAAGGVVAAIRTGCVIGDTGCGGGYGNYVIVYHQNGYFTLYSHLASVNVSTGMTVTPEDMVGVMGSTGRSGGTHLHFGVYRDNGNEQWDCNETVWDFNSESYCVDKPVDPHRWKKMEIADPWVADRGGPTSSSRLWLYDPDQETSFTGSQGVVITDTTETVQATIPPGTFSGQVKLELSPAPVAGSSAQLRSSGHSFWLRLLEWLPGGGDLQSVTALQSTSQFTLTQPITLTVTYTDTEVLHLDVSQLVLYRWDEDQKTWQPLPTTVDPAIRVATAQTQDLGGFELQAPLLCPTDDLEPDDGYPAARWVWPNDWPLARGLDIPQDSDWVRFDAVQGARYIIHTQNLAGGADTVLNLYDVDALTLLVSNDDANGGPASELVWTAPYTGTFFVEVLGALGGSTGCSATYELTIATIPGDVIADCQVDVTDIQAVAARWRLNVANPDPDGDFTTPNYETRFDLDGDGDGDVVDIMGVAARWGDTCS